MCAGGDVAQEDVLGLIAGLVDRSLVVMTDGPRGPRYRLLESVAAYCLEPTPPGHAHQYATVAEDTDVRRRNRSAPAPAPTPAPEPMDQPGRRA